MVNVEKGRESRLDALNRDISSIDASMKSLVKDWSLAPTENALDNIGAEIAKLHQAKQQKQDELARLLAI
ncbi:hypothetical protein AAFX24_28095 [Vibrio mediterranei]|uniref:hypothetical protein n=1 Tax=Vibrio mediterranei TaxID=689 RepID=UPI0038CDDA26